jgi:hypothetical protein
MPDSISNIDNIIDNRDVIARIDELKELIGDAPTAEELEADYGRDADDPFELEREELAALEALAADWEYGETLIRDSYFKEYAMELAEDIGAVNSQASWPNNCIDWDQAARELRMDYTSVDFGGVTYWIR